jgi:MFS family permease
LEFLHFVRENMRWLAGGFLLTYFSSFGQTFFISLSAGNIRSEYGLSHGEWGSLYMLATLSSALCLPWVGASVDRYAIWKVAAVTLAMLAFACSAMALSHNIVLLIVVIFILRLFGQGMMTQIAQTAMGKWYAARRGRAISIASIGINFGEATLPILFVIIAGALGWRNSWFMATLAIVIIAAPLILGLMRVERAPRSSDPVLPVSKIRDWTRGEVFRDPLFYIMLIGVLAAPFIGTTIFFHQIHLVEIRGWSLELFATTFIMMAVTVMVFALIAGFLVDRFSAIRLLPVYILPLAAACLVLGFFEQQWSAFVFMALLGVSYGFSTTLLGALWPELYGTGNLGAIRAAIVATMVFATAAGPGVTGFLIDLGVPYPFQIKIMGVYCLLASVAMLFASHIAIQRNKLLESSL